LIQGERNSVIRALAQRSAGEFFRLPQAAFSELESARGALGLPIERDGHFEPTMTIGAYGLNAVWDRRIKA